MKHNWVYKPLGEVCKVIGGSTPKTSTEEYWDGSNNWFTPAEINSKKYYSSSQRKITDKAIKDTGLTLLPKGTVLLTSRAPIGKVGILTEDSYCNQGFKNLVCGESLLNEYLYYCLIYFNKELNDKGHGPTFKEISKSDTEKFAIPVPPMGVQERIVAELDGINEVMANCRAMLAELDRLAGSLFYATFGDPIANPKAWPVKPLKEAVVGKLMYGSGASGVKFDGELRYIRITDIDDNGHLNDEIAVSPSEFDPKYLLKDGDILFARSGATVGKSYLYRSTVGKSIYAGYLIKAKVNSQVSFADIFVLSYSYSIL